jgi:hypothetical protein
MRPTAGRHDQTPAGPRGHVVTRNLALAAALVVCAGATAGGALSADGATNEARGPIITTSDETIGSVQAIIYTFDVTTGTGTKFYSEVTIRGNVRLRRGVWCVQTRLLPGVAGNPTRSRLVRASGPIRIPIPAFTLRRVSRFVSGDLPTDVAQVTVRTGGCSGRVAARGLATTRVFE